MTDVTQQHAPEHGEVFWHRVPPQLKAHKTVPADGETGEEEFTAAHAEKYVPPVPRSAAHKTVASPSLPIAKQPASKRRTAAKPKPAIQKSSAKPVQSAQPEVKPPAETVTKDAPAIVAPPPVEPDASAFLAALQQTVPNRPDKTDGPDELAPQASPASSPEVADAYEVLTAPLPRKRRRKPKLPRVLRGGRRGNKTAHAKHIAAPQNDTTDTPPILSTAARLPAPMYGDQRPQSYESPELSSATTADSDTVHPPAVSPMVDIESMAEHIRVDGASLLELYKQNRLDEDGLTRAVKAYQAGEDVGQVIDQEVLGTPSEGEVVVDDSLSVPPAGSSPEPRPARSFPDSLRTAWPVISSPDGFIGWIGHLLHRLFGTASGEVRSSVWVRRILAAAALLILYGLIFILLVTG